MKRVLLTGMSGTGKSSVIGELAALGHTAIDTDDGWCEPLLRTAADHEIRTTIPLADVVAKVVHLAGTRPGGLHHAGRARAEHRP